MQRKERMQSQKNGHSKIEQKNRVGKTATNIFNTKEQYQPTLDQKNIY